MDKAVKIKPKSKDAYPVFRGLSELGVTEQVMADAMAASLEDVAKWRCGTKRMPAQMVSFLTEFLGGLVENQQAQASYRVSYAQTVDTTERDRVSRAFDGLQQQRAFNRAFPSSAALDGIRLFQDWRRRTVTAQKTKAKKLPLSIQPSI